LSALLVLSATVTASASSPHCANALPIDLDETVRGDSRQIGEPDCFRLQTPTAGLLMLDLAVPGAAAAEPRLGLLRCARSGRVDVIDQSASYLLVASDAPRDLAVCVGAQDPGLALGAYKLRTAFVSTGGPGTRKAEEVEAEPDPFAGGITKAEEVEAEPDPFTGGITKAEEVEAEPDPFASDPLGAMCLAQESDDHSDSLLCATPVALGRDARGEIDNDWGDDQDVFVFELTAARTVRIETTGQVDTHGGLYDRLGQRLAAAGSGGTGDNFRLVKTLQPGVYFVRLEGMAWSRGNYELIVSVVERSW
jgi:hypothetical protein